MASASRPSILAALDRAGWQIDDEQPERIEASDGARYGVAVLFEGGEPAMLEYGDGKECLLCQEDWCEAPGILSPAEVGRLFAGGQGE